MELATIILLVVNLLLLLMSLGGVGVCVYWMNHLQRKNDHQEQLLTQIVRDGYEKIQQDIQKRDESLAAELGIWLKNFGEQLEKRDGVFASAIKDTYEEMDKNYEVLESVNTHLQRILNQRNLIDLDEYR